MPVCIDYSHKRNIAAIFFDLFHGQGSLLHHAEFIRLGGYGDKNARFSRDATKRLGLAEVTKGAIPEVVSIRKLRMRNSRFKACRNDTFFCLSFKTRASEGQHFLRKKVKKALHQKRRKRMV